MDNMIRIDKDYIEWLKHVKKRFKNTQIKASIKVNDELLRFYWSRAVLLNFLDTNLYEHQGKAISNFRVHLNHHWINHNPGQKH